MVTVFLCRRLRELLNDFKGLGGHHASWLAFRTELALEEVFFGRPSCALSTPVSVDLGISALHHNSLSHVRGFLCTSCPPKDGVSRDPPPLQTWFAGDTKGMDRVKRLFPLSDCLTGINQVVGDALVKVLLSDLIQPDDNLSIDMLRGPDVPRSKLVDCERINVFCSVVCSGRGFRFPHTFHRGLEIVRQMDKDPERCIELGLSGVKYFPKITYSR